jgi:hypothetical protein
MLVVLAVVTTEAVVEAEQRLLEAMEIDLTHLQARLLTVALAVLVLMLYLLGLRQQVLAHQDITQVVAVDLVFLLLVMAAVQVQAVLVEAELVHITLITTLVLDMLQELMALQILVAVVVQEFKPQAAEDLADLELLSFVI